MPHIPTQFPWQRYWVPHGEGPAMAGGYFVEPAVNELRWFSRISNGVALAELDSVPLLVLLGDVGMGKTTTVREEALALRARLRGPNNAVLYRDLKRLSEAQIISQVFEHTDVVRWLRGEHALTLFLDSLDECWRRFDQLESVLVGELEKRLEQRSETQPRLFVRLTCRSAEWRKETGHALQRLLTTFYKNVPAADILRTHALAPLSQENIRQAASHCAIDGEELLRRIAEKEAQPLAIHPITFEMLLTMYLERKDFPNTRRELFEEACTRLSAELHARPGSPSGRSMTVPQRVAIAGRLAATSILTNRNLLNPDVERRSQRLDVLEVTDVFGFYLEPCAGEHVQVNRDTMIETLQSGLFTGGGEALQQFRHPAYGDFLAARYLSRPEIPSTQLVGLLADTSDNSMRLFPQLEEAASWLADLRLEIFERLLRTNADVFLRCEPKQLNEGQRALLVESYLDLIRRHEAVEVDWQLKHRFSRLNHRGLAEQLRPVIANKQEHPLVRETAVDIAHFCDCKGVSGAIADVFFDPTDVIRLRKHAGAALEKLVDETLCKTLKARLTPEALVDKDDDVRGHLLKILWPSHLTVHELLPLLTPQKKHSYFGAYQNFIEYELPPSLPDSELPLSLRWLRENRVNFDSLGAFGNLPSKILRRAFARLDEPAVKDEIIALIKSLDHNLHYFFCAGFGEEQCPEPTRRQFIKVLVESDLDLSEVTSYGDFHRVNLLVSSDVPWFYSQFNSTTDATIQERWRYFMFAAFRVEDAEALDVVCELARKDSAAAESLARWTSCPLLPDEKNWRKEHYLEEQKRAAALKPAKPSFSEQIAKALRAFQDGRIPAFWYIIEQLQTDPTQERSFIAPHIRLSAGKAWDALDASLRQDIVNAVPDYLQREQFTEVQVWDEQTSWRACNQAVPAFVLLFDEARGLLENISPELWQKWTPVLITYRNRLNGTYDEAEQFIFALAARNAEEVFHATIRRYSASHLNNDHKRLVLRNLVAVWSPRIKQMLREFLDSKPVKPSAAHDLFEMLYQNEPQETLTLLESLMQSRNAADASSPLAPVATAFLLTHAPEQRGSEVIKIFIAEPVFGRAVIPYLIRGRQAVGWLLRIAAHDRARFWDWLEVNFPGDPYEDDDDGEIKAHSVTISHDIYHYRRGVLESLLRTGTREACSAMAELMRKRPQDFWLGNLLAQMRTAARRTTWSPPHPQDLMQMFADKERRIIRTAGDLHALLLESIARFEATLHGNPPSLELWNCVSSGTAKTWDPKDENNLSDCLKRHIQTDLERHGIIANREVQITRRFGDDPAEVVDLLVQATPLEENGTHGKPVSVVIEVKCAWNKDVFEDMEQQLYARYLRRDFDFGIYLVAQFACAVWNRNNDWRKSAAGTQIPALELEARLNQQAVRLSSQEKKLNAIVIDAGVR